VTTVDFTMNKTITFVLAIGALIIAGCSSPVRTIEYKNGMTIMTERQGDERTPRTWELKEVTSTVEMNTLCKAGWQSEGIVHLGGIDTFLLKRRVKIQTIVPLPFRPMLTTALGTTTTPDGSWRIAATETTLDLSRLTRPINENGLNVTSTIGMPGWTAKAGWFVYVESESRVWSYDGDRQLYLYTETSNNGSVYYGSFGAAGFDSNFPSVVPAEVISHLPEKYQKEIQTHQ